MILMTGTDIETVTYRQRDPLVLNDQGTRCMTALYSCWNIFSKIL